MPDWRPATAAVEEASVVAVLEEDTAEASAAVADAVEEVSVAALPADVPDLEAYRVEEVQALERAPGEVASASADRRFEVKLRTSAAQDLASLQLGIHHIGSLSYPDELTDRELRLLEQQPHLIVEQIESNQARVWREHFRDAD
jgi:hypothetical protein